MGFEKEQRPFLGERYISGESKTQSRFIDEKPVYRRVIQFTGAANVSTTTVGALANLISTLITANWSVLDGTVIRANAANSAAAPAPSGVSIVESTGAITIDHDGYDFSTETVTLILEYTKQ